MKKVIPVLLFAASATGLHAQTSDFAISKNPTHRAKVVGQATKDAHKPTALYYRISATSGYALDIDDMTTSLVDSGKYNYSNGRGSVITFEEMFINDYGLESTLNYDTALKFSDNGGGLDLMQRYSATYNAGNKRTAFVFAYKQSGNMVNNYEEKAVYNANGDISTRTASYWDMSQSKWTPMQATEYKYDNQNRLLVDSTHILTISEPSDVTYYTYDGSGNNVANLSLQWNGTNWDSAYRTINTYYPNNKIKTITEEFYNYDSTRWEYSYFDSLGYTAGGELEYRLYREWDSATAGWMNSELETRTYANGKPATLAFSYWDEANNNWDNEGEGEAFYNTRGDLYKVEIYMYIGGVKIPFPAFTQNLYYEEYYNVGVKDASKDNKLTVYPNPAGNVVNILLDGMQNAQVQLISATGQVVRSVTTSNQQQLQLNTANLPAGNYILNVCSNNDAPARQIITIQ